MTLSNRIDLDEEKEQSKRNINIDLGKTTHSSIKFNINEKHLSFLEADEYERKFTQESKKKILNNALKLNETIKNINSKKNAIKKNKIIKPSIENSIGRILILLERKEKNETLNKIDKNSEYNTILKDVNINTVDVNKIMKKPITNVISKKYMIEEKGIKEKSVKLKKILKMYKKIKNHEEA